MIAKGAPPTPVDPVETPWAVIQPVFREFRCIHDQDTHISDSPMFSDESKDSLGAILKSASKTDC